MPQPRLTLPLLIAILIAKSAYAQLFETKQTLHSSTAYNDYYTESIYSAIDSYNGAIYFVKIDANRRPVVGKIDNGVETTEFLAKDLPSYQARASDGHHEFSIGIDKDGYIHITGDMHNQPQAANSHLPAEIKDATILYWKSSSPGDISDFDFVGFNAAERIPGLAWSYGHFVTDRNGVLYYSSRTLARTQYYQKWDSNGGVGRGLGLYVYNTTTKAWTARGELAPNMADASYKVIVYDPSGHAAPQQSYQQYKAGIFFDKTNRMHLALGMNINQATKLNAIIYAYSDDGGITFKKANGDAIQLPMTGDTGPHQADLLVNNTDNSTNMDQATVTAAWNNYPVVHFEQGSGKYKHWNGSSWSNTLDSPTGKRDFVLFNEHTDDLYFIDIHSGNIHSKSSIEGATEETYNAGAKFQHYDIKTFRSQNILNFVSWQSSGGSGDFDIIQLTGANVTPPLDCNNDTGGTAYIDDCGECAAGQTGVIPNSSCLQDCNGTWGGSAYEDDCQNCVGGTTGEISCNRDPFNGTPALIPGTIEFEEYDIGANGMTYYDITMGNTGSQFRTDDVDIELANGSLDEYNVGWVEDQEWLEYTVDVQTSGNYDFEFFVASETGSAGFHVLMDQSIVVPTLTVPATGGWQSYSSLEVSNVPLLAGEQILRLVTEGSATNLDKVVITPSNVTGTHDSSIDQSLKLFPNPASADGFEVVLKDYEQGSWELVNSMGVIVSSGDHGSRLKTIEVSTPPQLEGLFEFRFVGEHNRYASKVVITQ